MLSATIHISAQTPIKVPTNKHDIKTDLKISEIVDSKNIHDRLPLIIDLRLISYLKTLSSQLEKGIPPEFRYSDFKYTFYIIDFSGIAVFSIPGGAIYISRGAMIKARGEGELLGLMAHGMSHIALRHYTAKLPKVEEIDWMLLELGILNTFVEGKPGYIDYRGLKSRSAPYKIKFNDDIERQADILAAQILARANHDPHALGNVYLHIKSRSDVGYCPSDLDPHERKQMLYREARQLQAAGLYDPRKGYFMSEDFLPMQKFVTELPKRQRGSILFPQ